MKILVTTEGDTVDSMVSNRLARAPFFLVYDDITTEWVSLSNPYQQEHGMGTRIAQFASEKGIKAILGAAPGPNARVALDALGIAITVYSGISAKEAVSLYLKQHA
jgi:predicted Fe-Mo cluster-binding NifX family protein